MIRIKRRESLVLSHLLAQIHRLMIQNLSRSLSQDRDQETNQRKREKESIDFEIKISFFTIVI